MSSRSCSLLPALVLVLGVVVPACGGDNTKLMVTGLEPDKGDSNGETYVRIKGNRFTADGPRIVKVYFGGRPGKWVRTESDNEIVVQPPGGKPGEAVDVLIVFEPGGSKTISNAYRWIDRSQAAPTVDDLVKKK
jgi:hypothetical protein